MPKDLNILGFIPARGGSKSILYKNIAPLNDIPLISYCISAALEGGVCSKIVCSTEDEKIAKVVRNLGVDIDKRPLSLAADHTPVSEVILEYLGRCATTPDLVFLIQPTSPFVRGQDFCRILDALEKNPSALSAQTVCIAEHNNHPFNSRILSNGLVEFMFENERIHAHNKQTKPQTYSFGNLICFRPEALEDHYLGVFAKPSIGVEISWPYNFDVDNELQLKIAHLLIENDFVKL